MEMEYGRFVWDVAKELENMVKHGVRFDDASEAFLDPQRCMYIDRKHSLEELRLFCLGKVKDRVLTVRFTYRGDSIRIIGAGYWRQGEKTYEKENPR